MLCIEVVAKKEHLRMQNSACLNKPKEDPKAELHLSVEVSGLKRV